MIGGRGERVREIRDEDLVEIGLPVYAQTFKNKQRDAKMAEQKESQGIVEAYAAVVELGNSEDGIVFDKEQARKKLVELVVTRNKITERFGITRAYVNENGARYVSDRGTAWAVKGAHTKSSYGSGINVTERNLELEKNFETISTIFGAYEYLKEIFKDFDKYIDGLCEDYSAELEAKARASAEQKQKRLVLEREERVEGVIANMKVAALAAKRAASGSGRSQLTVEEIQEISLRAEKSVPKIPVEKPEMSKGDQESLERVRASNSYPYTIEELEEEVKALGK